MIRHKRSVPLLTRRIEKSLKKTPLKFVAEKDFGLHLPCNGFQQELSP
jgi:hypothetical protein